MGYQLLLRGLNPPVATLSTPDAAQLIVATQLPSDNAGSARGAASPVAEAITTAKAALTAQHRHSEELVVRADSAFCGRSPSISPARSSASKLPPSTEGAGPVPVVARTYDTRPGLFPGM